MLENLSKYLGVALSIIALVGTIKNWLDSQYLLKEQNSLSNNHVKTLEKEVERLRGEDICRLREDIIKIFDEQKKFEGRLSEIEGYLNGIKNGKSEVH